MKLRHGKPSQVLPDDHADGHHVRRRGPVHAERLDPAVKGLRGKFRQQPVLNTTLVALSVATSVLAYTAIGPASQSSGQSARTTTVKRGVVQSTVSGSGNVQSADELNLGFKTGGTVTHIYISKGQHVTQGQLLATLDPKSAEVTLQQAQATLKSAEATLAQEEENEGETSSGGGSATSTSAGTTATKSNVAHAANVGANTAGEATHTNASTPTTATGTPSTPTETSTTPTTTTPAKTTTAPASTTATPSSPISTSKSGGSSHAKTTTSTATSATNGSGQSTSSSNTKQSTATREANLASARAAVKSDKLTVESDEQAVQNTKLYAPETGTIVSLSGEVGETVSGTGTSKAASSSSSSSASSSSGAGGKSGSAGGASTTGTASGASGSSSSSSSFAVLGNLESLQLVVALSESEIGNVEVGQIATVTLEALNGRKLAAHVLSVGQVPLSTSGAVSYDVTFQLDQGASGLKVGMSATAEVLVKQAEGLNVPTSAIKAGSITVVRNGKQTTVPVTTGLAGDSSTIVLSGLQIGEQVVLPTATSNKSGSALGAGSSSRGGAGGGGFSGGGGGFPGGGPPGG